MESSLQVEIADIVVQSTGAEHASGNEETEHDVDTDDWITVARKNHANGESTVQKILPAHMHTVRSIKNCSG